VVKTFFPIPIPGGQFRQGVPNASLRQLELMGDRGLLFSGAADWAKEQALKPMQLERAWLQPAAERRRVQGISNRIAPYQP